MNEYKLIPLTRKETRFVRRVVQEHSVRVVDMVGIWIYVAVMGSIMLN